MAVRPPSRARLRRDSVERKGSRWRCHHSPNTRVMIGAASPAATPTIAFPLPQSRGRDIDPCSHPAGASGHETSAGAVNSLRKQLFLTSVRVRCSVWPHRCGTRADQLRPIERCDDLAAETAKVPNSSWLSRGWSRPAGLLLISPTLCAAQWPRPRRPGDGLTARFGAKGRSNPRLCGPVDDYRLDQITWSGRYMVMREALPDGGGDCVLHDLSALALGRAPHAARIEQP